MAVKKKITNTSIKQLTIEDGRLNDTEISGFHARISPKGAIKYYFYYRLNGKQRNYLIGSADSMTPAQARDLAKEKRGWLPVVWMFKSSALKSVKRRCAEV